MATGSSVVMVRLQAGTRSTTASRPRVRDAPKLIGVLTEVPPIPPRNLHRPTPGNPRSPAFRTSGLHSPLFAAGGVVDGVHSFQSQCFTASTGGPGSLGYGV